MPTGWLLAIAVVVIYVGVVLIDDDKGWSFWLDQTRNGLTTGSLYALIALGYTMVYGVLRMINFAHGEVFMIGSFTGWVVLTKVFGGNDMSDAVIAPAILVAMLAAAVVTAGSVIVIERIAYRPLRHAPRLAPLISAIGVSIFLQNLFLRLTEGRFRQYPRIFPQGPGESVDLGFTSIDYIEIFLIGSSILMMLALYLFVQRTKMGVSIRAVAEDQEVSALMGVNVNRVIALTFVIGAALAGVAGVMYGLWLLNIKGTMGFLPGIKAFTAAVLGGIGNIPGAMAGGFLIGLAESVGREQLNSVFNPVLHWIGAGGLGLGNEWKDVVAFVVLVGVLLLRPTGIFGEVVGKRA
ncbi:MAG TPA: branched-chain amino acid ABC transporter permease [Dehalococcoidia bacterium]|nr:branched-chain amino acid ABC transporter permease [Dehalococcoidia bacterium]